MNYNKSLSCKCDHRYKFHPDAPFYCPECNRYDWYDGNKFENSQELEDYPMKYPLDWLAKELGVYEKKKVYFGNANYHALHRITIANRIINHWLGVPIEKGQYTLSDIFNGLNELLETQRHNDQVELNKMEAEIYGYYRLMNFRKELNQLLKKYNAQFDVDDVVQSSYEFGESETVILLTIGEIYDDDGERVERYQADLGVSVYPKNESEY